MPPNMAVPPVLPGKFQTTHGDLHARKDASGMPSSPHSRIDGGSEIAGRRKAGYTACAHLDGPSVLGIAHTSRLSMGNVECAKTRNRDTISLHESRLNPRQKCLQRSCGLQARDFCVQGDFADHIPFVHRHLQCPRYISKPRTGVNAAPSTGWHKICYPMRRSIVVLPPDHSIYTQSVPQTPSNPTEE
jgi:hypothetical protein